MIIYKYFFYLDKLNVSMDKLELVERQIMAWIFKIKFMIDRNRWFYTTNRGIYIF